MEAVILKLIEENKNLQATINDLNQKMKPLLDPYESDETKEIHTALSKAQGQFPSIGFNKQNPFFKSQYADLDGIMRQIRPILSANNLAYTQQTTITSDGAMVLRSRIRHSSGQWIESRSRIVPVKNDPQSFASTLSYLKRHLALSLLNITCSDDIYDDDAEIAMVESRDGLAKGTSLNIKYNPKDQSFDTITKEQIEELEYELAEYPDIAEQVLDGFKIQSIADIPKSKFQPAINRIREIKALRNGLIKK